MASPYISYGGQGGGGVPAGACYYSDGCDVGRIGASPSSSAELGMYDLKTERIIRHGFIRKVYGIVGTQLFVTTLVSLAMVSTPVSKVVLLHALPLLIICAVGSLVTLLILYCKEGAAHRYPGNYILLGVFTIFKSLTMGLLCCCLEMSVLAQGFVATTIIVAGLTAFAFQTKYDFSSWVGVMFYVLLGMVVFGLIKIIFWNSPLMDACYSAIMAIVFSIYLVVDTQLMIGNGKIRIQEDDYVYAAIMIYLDIINLFVHLVQLISYLRRD